MARKKKVVTEEVTAEVAPKEKAPEEKKTSPKKKIRMFKAKYGTMVHPGLKVAVTLTPTAFPDPDDSWLNCQIRAGKIEEC